MSSQLFKGQKGTITDKNQVYKLNKIIKISDNIVGVQNESVNIANCNMQYVIGISMLKWIHNSITWLKKILFFVCSNTDKLVGTHIEKVYCKTIFKAI